MESWVWILLIGVIYFSPAINAYSKKKRNRKAVLVLNFFLGWTLIGWVVALVWATTVDKEEGASLSPKSSSVEELHKLAELKEKGVLTEDEFNKKKQEILNS